MKNPMASGKPQNIDQKPSGEKDGKISQKEQSERFIETARKLEIDEDGAAFNDVVNQILDRDRTAKPK